MSASLFIRETEKLLIEIQSESVFPVIFGSILICVNPSLIIRFFGSKNIFDFSLTEFVLPFFLKYVLSDKGHMIYVKVR